MFVGHYAAAFAVKAARSSIPLWTLFLAVQLVDVAWALLVLAGVEKIDVIPGFMAASALDAYYIPYTHSLPAALVWSGAAVLFYRYVPRQAWPAAILIGAAVISHWLLDLLVHGPDLPLYDDTAKVGFGLWNYPALSYGLETGLLVAAVWLFLHGAQPSPALRRGVLGFAGVLVAFQTFYMFGPTMEDPDVLVSLALAAFLTFPAIAGSIEWWASLSDRGVDPTGAQLVIGHTTHDSARIWVRGDERRRFASVSLRVDGGEAIPARVLRLRAADDFTGVAPFRELRAGTRYEVSARFAESREALMEEGRASGASGEVVGTFATFPEPDADAPFSFLHGSCNLSIVSLTNLGSLAAGAAGLIASTESLERRPHGGRLWQLARRVGDGLARLVTRIAFWCQMLLFRLGRLRERLTGRPGPERPHRHEKVSLPRFVFSIVYGLTGFKQRKPVLPNPYTRLHELLDHGLGDAEPPAFMIHAGDQIYFDFPFPHRQPSLEAYRLAYREAWFEDDELPRLLRRCPHYMTLDDHEIVDGFAVDGIVLPKGRSADDYRAPATRAYHEYVNARHPTDGELVYDYAFDVGATRFFVMDTRTRRSATQGRMIDAEQQRRFEAWLTEHRDDLKFVVSSVPFVAEVDSTHQEGDDETKLDQRNEKWCGRTYRDQRDEIIAYLHENRIGRLVFLVGDMHCCYHAAMRIGWPHDRIGVHELAGGPLYQLQFGTRDQYLEEHRGFAGADGKTPVRTSLQQIHGTASAVLHVTVGTDRSEVRWEVVRTSPALGEGHFVPRPVSGRIRFEEQRRV